MAYDFEVLILILVNIKLADTVISLELMFESHSKMDIVAFIPKSTFYNYTN